MNQAFADPAELQTTRRLQLVEGIYLTRQGAWIDPESEADITIDTYLEAVSRCQLLSNATLWTLGDLLCWGEKRPWGEMYSQALDVTHKSVSTLQAAARASREYPMADRVSGVSWSHHREALVLPRGERRAVLEEAAKMGVSAMALREQLGPVKVKKPTVCPQCGHEW